MQHPLLSILIPVYNVASYLDECLQSIVDQGIDSYEVILIDDGSTDDSGKVCDDWCRKVTTFHCIHRENRGVSATRNQLLQEAKGDYLTFVDPDDFLAPETYRTALTLLEAHPETDILQFPYCKYFEDTKTMQENAPTPLTFYRGHEEILAQWWAGSPINYVVWDKIYRRELFEGITFWERNTSEDTRMTGPLSAKAGVVCLTDKGKYYYRMRSNSLSARYGLQEHLDLFHAHLAIFREMLRYPSLRLARVRAFERMFWRLIQAQRADRKAALTAEYNELQQLYPPLNDIQEADGVSRSWLKWGRLLGVRLLTSLQIRYLNLKSYAL